MLKHPTPWTTPVRRCRHEKLTSFDSGGLSPMIDTIYEIVDDDILCYPVKSETPDGFIIDSKNCKSLRIGYSFECSTIYPKKNRYILPLEEAAQMFMSIEEVPLDFGEDEVIALEAWSIRREKRVERLMSVLAERPGQSVVVMRESGMTADRALGIFAEDEIIYSAPPIPETPAVSWIDIPNPKSKGKKRDKKPDTNTVAKRTNRFLLGIA